MSNRITIHHGDHEGAFHIDATDGINLTPIDERPEWADGYAVALLAERTGWYEKRLGEHLPDSLVRPEVMDARDLGWVAFDHNGAEVEIEADTEFRMAALHDLLAPSLEKAPSFEIDETYATQPTNEATLADVEGVGFEEMERKAVNA